MCERAAPMQGMKALRNNGRLDHGGPTAFVTETVLEQR